MWLFQAIPSFDSCSVSSSFRQSPLPGHALGPFKSEEIDAQSMKTQMAQLVGLGLVLVTGQEYQNLFLVLRHLIVLADSGVFK